jgi:hypothetical protein
MPSDVLLVWLAVAGPALIAIGFLLGEIAAHIHYDHTHKH